MGLLDDAIREHLDLKRRRGADPAEVERAEREALGPVRRNREASASDVEVEDEPVAGGLAYDQADEDDWTDDDGHEQPEDAAPEQADLPPLELSGDQAEAESPRAPAGESETAFDETALGESAFEEPMFDEEPPPAQPPSFTERATGAETAEYDVEEAMAADEESGEDVLEETPEFLQDTPDHDRLWFEQRPPKDFDFDG